MNNSIKVLLIEDETPIVRFLRAGLSGENYQLIEATTGREGIRSAATFAPEIILLDLGLPDMDGLSVAREIRGWSKTPIIVLSARGQEQDKIDALDGGADDYLTKPFGIGELLARMRVALRNAHRGDREGDSIFETGDLRIEFGARRVLVRGIEVHLTPIEYKLLSTLTRHADRVVTHKQLLTEVWGAAYARETPYLRVFMGQLRHKIEADPSRPKFLTTEAGVGYRFRTAAS